MIIYTNNVSHRPNLILFFFCSSVPYIKIERVHRICLSNYKPRTIKTRESAKVFDKVFLKGSLKDLLMKKNAGNKMMADNPKLAQDEILYYYNFF